MSDVIYLLLVLAFFVLAAGLVRACEHIIGPDELVAARPEPDATPAGSPEAVAA